MVLYFYSEESPFCSVRFRAQSYPVQGQQCQKVPVVSCAGFKQTGGLPFPKLSSSLLNGSSHSYLAGADEKPILDFQAQGGIGLDESGGLR